MIGQINYKILQNLSSKTAEYILKIESNKCEGIK